MNIVFGIGAFQSLLFSLLLITKKNRQNADKYLAGFFFIITLYLGNSFSVGFGLWKIFPDIIVILTLVSLSCGPVLYFYVNSLLGKPLGKKQVLFHLLPILLVFFIILPFIFQSKDDKLLYFTDKFINLPLNISFGTFIQYLSAPIYFIWIITLLKKHKQYLHDNHSSIDKINLDWMRKLLIGVIIIWLIDCFNVYLLNFSSIDLSYNISWYIKFTLMIFIIIIGYYGINQGAIFVNPIDTLSSDNLKLISEDVVVENMNALLQNIHKKDSSYDSKIKEIASNLNVPMDVLLHSINVNIEKYKVPNTYEEGKLISDDKAVEYIGIIKNYMQNEKAFLNSDLRIQDVAVGLNIPLHIVSYLINKKLGKNFYDFVNTYRIEEAKKRLKNSAYNNLTIVSIAFDCGFNSKATFNRLFKLHTGITPSQFKK